MFLTDLKHNLLNFLAQSLNRWADVLREKMQAPNSKINSSVNSAELPENLLPREDWLHRTESKPPQDWLERVSRGAPELLLDMPEFIVQTTENNDRAKPIEMAEIEISPRQISRSKNVAAADTAEKVQLSKKPQAHLPLQNSANKTDSKPLFSPLRFFKSNKETNRRVEPTGDDSTDSDYSTKFADKNASRANSNFIRSKSSHRNAQQTSIIKFNRREPESVNESSLAASKTDHRLAKNLPPQQIIEPRHSSESATDHKQIKVEQKSNLVISQQIFGHNESPETNTNRIETDLNNFILPKRNSFNNRQIIASSFVDKKSQAKPNNPFPQETVKIAAPKLPAAMLQPQEKQWADLPQLTETSAEIFDEFEVFSQKNKHLCDITLEQTGGGWNE